MDADRRREAEDLLASGRIEEALSILNKSIEQESASDPETFYLLGRAHFRLGDFSTAESELRKAISLDPSRADAFYYLGLTAERQKRNDDALKSYQTALALNPTLEKAREKVGKLSGFGTEATSNTVGQKTGAKQPESELLLPRSEAEFDDYELRRRRKAEIDQRAERDAQVKLSHDLPQVISRSPWWVKVGMVVFAGIFVLTLIVIITAMVGMGRMQQGMDHSTLCDHARQRGLPMPPGC